MTSPVTDPSLSVLLDLSDDVGVLSFYVGITPDRAGQTSPPWRIAIDNGVRDVLERTSDAATRSAIERRIARIEGEITALSNFTRHGRGRAMFVTVAGGEVHHVGLQVPFADRVRFGSRPYLRPLVAAWDEGRSAGVVSLHRDGARLSEWKVGELTTLVDDEFDGADPAWREKKGPAGGNASGTHGLNHRERFADRVDENRRRFLASFASQVLDTADKLGWDRVVVAGDSRLRAVVSEPLKANGRRVLGLERTFEDEGTNEVAEAVWPVLRAAHLDREADLVSRVCDAALSGGAGALGLRDVLAAVNENRVSHLVFDNEIEPAGVRTEDGLLFVQPSGYAAQADLEFHDESALVERALERVLASDGRVTPLATSTAEPLADHDGIGALLRW